MHSVCILSAENSGKPLGSRGMYLKDALHITYRKNFK